jgi:hypothetical protein
VKYEGLLRDLRSLARSLRATTPFGRLMNNSGEQAVSPAPAPAPALAPAQYQGSPPANRGNDIDIDAFMGTGIACPACCPGLCPLQTAHHYFRPFAHRALT